MRWAALVVLWASVSPVAAVQADSEMVRALLARIEKLEKRVAELETRGGPAAAVPVEKAPPMVHHTPPEAVAPEAHYTAPNLHIGGFSDANFSASDQRGARSGFSEGQFILHLSSALSQRVNFFGEISMTARPDAGTGMPPATAFNVEIERSIIRFDQSDRLKLSFGRYHTPINYFNTAYHHGSWLHTTVSRPEMAQFGGRFIPVHFVGGLVEGTLPAGGWNLNYNAGIGNGRGAVISRGGDFGDANNNRAWLVNLFVKPDALNGFQAGWSFYRDKISLARDWRETISSGHIVWSREPEIIAEFANVRHIPVGGGGATSNSQAWYVQAGYRLPIWAKLWKPYYRYEYIHIPRADEVFRDLPGLSGSMVGVRYDISPFAAFKWEYRSIKRPGLARINAGVVQTSFTF
ncbi:MAG: hypothetical protein ACRD8O_21015 [Bryobacteraceae bacterium]